MSTSEVGLAFASTTLRRTAYFFLLYEAQPHDAPGVKLVAKHVVAAGFAPECEVQLSYTIGLAGPVSVQVETHGKSQLSDTEIAERVKEMIDFRLAAIIRKFRLRDLPQADEVGFYPRLSAFGHVGRTDVDLPWEQTDSAEVIA